MKPVEKSIHITEFQKNLCTLSCFEMRGIQETLTTLSEAFNIRFRATEIMLNLKRKSGW